MANDLPRKGHRSGGPLRFGLLAAGVVAAGCGAGGNGGPGQPSPDDGVLRPLQVYRELGMLAGSEQFPAVASFTTLAGPADSTYVIFGLSMPNSALRFQRDDKSFAARYLVSLSFVQDSQVVRKVDDQRIVRVATFDETSRTDESIVYQTAVPLVPGTYAVDLEARDGSGGRGFRARDTITVPAYRSGGVRLSAPMFVYEAEARDAEDDAPNVIVNPRHTVPFGGDTQRMYVEAYDVPPGRPVQVRVVNDADEEVWSTETPLVEASGLMRYALVDVPTSSLPLGKFWLETTVPGVGAASRVPVVVTISDRWMVANFDEVFEFLTYIATGEELDSLRNAEGEARAAAWERFWERRDPLAATAINEFREQFFERIRMATLYFDEPGRPGWRTDRGEVFIVLGPPSYVRELRSSNQMGVLPTGYEWLYESGPFGRMTLVFVDRRDFGRYELTTQSESTFRAAADRLKRRR